MQINKSLATFTSVAELNEAIRKHLYLHKRNLTKSAISLLKLLARYSCKVIGVSWFKGKTLANELNVSPATIWNAIDRLEKLGIIKRVSGTDDRRRSNGKFGSNVYVIQAPDSELQLPSSQNLTRNSTRQIRDGQAAETPVVSMPEASKNSRETMFSYTLSSKDEDLIKNVETGSLDTVRLDHTYTPDYVPAAFVKIAKVFGGAVTIEKLWTKVKLAYRKLGLSEHVVDLDIVLATVKHVVWCYRQNRIKSDIFGCFYNKLTRLLTKDTSACDAAATATLPSSGEDVESVSVTHAEQTNSELLESVVLPHLFGEKDKGLPLSIVRRSGVEKVQSVLNMDFDSARAILYEFLIMRGFMDSGTNKLLLE